MKEREKENQVFHDLGDATLKKQKMAAAKGTLRICRNGHRYYKSSDCPTCPVCEKTKQPKGFLSLLSAPARRALENGNIHTEKALAKFSEKEILKLHGMGKASLPTLRSALQKKGLSFKKDDK